MSEKVKLPKKVANAMDALDLNNEAEKKWAFFNISTLEKENLEPYAVTIKNYFHPHYLYLAAAIINGYEVELTPEEKIQEKFIEWRRLVDEHGDASQIFEYDKHKHFLWAARTILDILEIKIEGVNS